MRNSMGSAGHSFTTLDIKLFADEIFTCIFITLLSTEYQLSAYFKQSSDLVLLQVGLHILTANIFTNFSHVEVKKLPRYRLVMVVSVT